MPNARHQRNGVVVVLLLGDVLRPESLLHKATLAVGEAQRPAQPREPHGAVLSIPSVVPVTEAVLDLRRLRQLEDCIKPQRC